jgi:hypothetical protein
MAKFTERALSAPVSPKELERLGPNRRAIFWKQLESHREQTQHVERLLAGRPRYSTP